MNTFRFVLITVLLLLFLPYAVLVLVDGLHHASLLYPTPRTRSTFLTNYAPALVVEAFTANANHSSGTSVGGGPGENYVTHDNSFNFQLPLPPAGQRLLQTALYNDIISGLRNSNARILEQAGDPSTGVQISYRSGNSNGCIRLLPMEPQTWLRPARYLPPDVVDTYVEIRVAEWWSPGSSAPPPQEQARLCSTKSMTGFAPREWHP